MGTKVFHVSFDLEVADDANELSVKEAVTYAWTTRWLDTVNTVPDAASSLSTSPISPLCSLQREGSDAQTDLLHL